MQQANLHEASFKGAKLQGANFKECEEIEIANFKGSLYDYSTQFSQDFLPDNYGLIYKKVRESKNNDKPEINEKIVKLLDDYLSATELEKTKLAAEKSLKLRLNSRQGQLKFRNSLLKIYADRCAITRFKIPGLEAAHIKPFVICNKNEASDPDNGILLRADLHTLFDLGLIQIHPETLKLKLMAPLLESPYKKFDEQQLLSYKQN